jgi:hypothetical protein
MRRIAGASDERCLPVATALVNRRRFDVARDSNDFMIQASSMRNEKSGRATRRTLRKEYGHSTGCVCLAKIQHIHRQGDFLAAAGVQRAPGTGAPFST